MNAMREPNQVALGEGGQHVLILRPPLGSGAVAISLLRSLQGDDECQTSHRIDR